MRLTTDNLVSTLAECEPIIHNRFRRRLSFLNRRFDTDDLYQVVCMKALKFFGQCKAENESQLKHWVLVIAKNACESAVTEHLGMNNRTIRKEQVAIGVATAQESNGFDPAYESDPSRVMELKEEFGHALSRLDRIPKVQQRALELRYLNQMEYAEIAAELGQTENAVRLMVSRGASAVRGESAQPCLPGFESQYIDLVS